MGEEPERLREALKTFHAYAERPDLEGFISGAECALVLAEVERLARDNAAIRTCYYPAPEYVKIEMERNRLRGEVERLAGDVERIARERQERTAALVRKLYETADGNVAEGFAFAAAMCEQAEREAEDAEARAERLAGERDMTKGIAGRLLLRAEKAETECERLAGRVAAYKSALEEIAAHVVVSEGEFPDDNCDWHCTLTMQARAKDVLVDVGGSE